jgi:hypothetical protein
MASSQAKKNNSLKSLSRYPRIEKLAIAVFVISFLLMVFTGFLSPGLNESPTQSYLVLIHMVVGAVFTASLTVWVILWADACQFDKAQGGLKNPVAGTSSIQVRFLVKLSFWVMVLLSLGLIMTAVLALLKWAGSGSQGQYCLMQIHRFFAWLSIVAFCLLGFQGFLKKK